MVAHRPILTTNRLILKPLALEDETAIERLLEDPRIARMTSSISFPNPSGATQGFLERVIDAANPDITWAINRNDDLLGVITLRGDGELGYWLGPEHWGQGIMTEAGQAIVAFGFERGETRIHAQHFIDNPTSGRVMEKLGLVKIGMGTPVYCPSRDKTVEQLLYERMRDD